MNGYLDKFKQRTTERKQPLRDAIQMSKAMLSSTISLSEAIKKYPQCVDETKIRLVQKQINRIDIIVTPKSLVASIDTLYLSNNSLTSLQGIPQFPNLLHLSLSNNAIKDISTLQELRNMPGLESLNLQGNPVVKHPIYRALVLTALPNLSFHDGRSISKDERVAAEIQVKKQNSLLDLMLVNYIEIQKLNYISKKLELHEELSRGNSKLLQLHLPHPATAFKRKIHLPVMKRVIDLQSAFPDHVKHIMIDNLMADVLTLYHEAMEREGSNAGNGNVAEQCYEKAFSTLLMKQQHLLAALNHENQEKADCMNELQEKLDTNFREQSRHHSPEAAQLRARSSDDEIHYNQGDLYRFKDAQSNLKSHKQPNKKQQQQRSRKTSPPSKLVFKKTSPRSDTLSPSPDDRDTRLESTNQITSTQSYKSQQLKKQSQSLNNKYGASAASVSGSPSFSSLKTQEIVTEGGGTTYFTGRNGQLNRKKSTETNNEGCCRRLMNSSEEEIEEFKQNQHMKSAYRRTNVQLSHDVNQLQDTVSTQQMRILELSATLDEQQTLTSQAEKLEYPTQRQDVISSNEINHQESLSDDAVAEEQEPEEQYRHRSQQQSNASEQKNQFENTSDVVPPWITDELQEMRNQINALMSQNLHLQESSALKEEEEKNTRDKQENLIHFLSSELENREANESLAESFNQLRRKRLVFTALSSAVRIERTITAFKQAHSESSLNLSGYFGAWHRKTLLSSYIVAENRTRIEFNLKFHLRTWFANVRFASRLRELQREQAQRRIFTVFVELKSHARLKQQREQKTATAIQFHRKCLILKAYKHLKQQMQKHRITPGEQHRLEIIAEKYSNHRARCKFFDAWKDYLTTHATPLKESLVEFKANRTKRILSSVFRVLQIERITAKEMARRANNYRNFQMKRMKSILFKKWKAMSASTKLKKVSLEKYVVLSKLKHMFSIWTQTKKQNHLSKKQTLLAITHARRSLQSKYFKVLKQRRSRLISDSINSVALAEIHAKRRLETSFGWWLARARPAYQATLALRVKAKTALHAAFAGWRKAIAWKAKKQMNASALEEYFRESRARKSKAVFDGIKKYYLMKRKNRTLLVNFNASRKFKLYRELLLRLAQNQSNDFKVTLEQKNRELNAAEQLAFNAETEAQELMKAHDEHADETQRLKEELFQAKLLIEQFQHEHVKHNSNVRAIERKERIFEEDRANYERKFSELEHAMQLMVQEHHESIQEKDSEIERAVQENRSAYKQIASLQNEIQFRQSTLIETERALLHRGDQSTVMIKETEKKLQNSIEMAAVFRDKITEQESEIDDLKDSLHSTQIDVEDLKTKLRESISLIKETSEMYDEKILDFTTIIDAKSAQIASLQFANDKKESQIAQLNALNYRPDNNTLQHQSSSAADFMRTYGGNTPSPIEQDDEQIIYDFKDELQNVENELVEQRKILDVRMAMLNSNLVHIQNEEKKRQFQVLQSPESRDNVSQEQPVFINQQQQQHQTQYSTNKNIAARFPPLLFSESSATGVSPCSDQKFVQLSDRYNKTQQRLNQHRIPNGYRGVLPQKDQIPSRDGVTSSNSNNSNTTTVNPRSQQIFLNDLQKDLSLRAAFKDQISRRITQLNSDIDRELATADNIRSRSRSPEIVDLSFRSRD